MSLTRRRELERLEQYRLIIQAELDGKRLQRERNQLGQFATPFALASEMLESARGLLPKGKRIRFLDPAIGSGSFFSAFLKHFPPSQVTSGIGYEIDPEFAYSASKLWAAYGLNVRNADFTEAKAPSTDSDMANLIVCNPPYVRHHHISAEVKKRLGDLIQRNRGIRFSGLSGLYCYFLALSLDHLAPDGLAIWLIPSEFMDVNYGKQVKQLLLTDVNLIRIHRFSPYDVQFSDALVSSVIVWLRGTPSDHENGVEFSFGGSILNPKVTQMISRTDLLPSAKWTRFPTQSRRTSKQTEGVKLSDLFQVKRGIATGANDFFLLTPEAVQDHLLPNQVLTPILPSPRHLKEAEISADENGEPLIDKKYYLVSCDLPEEAVRDKFPALWKYLESGRDKGVHTRYLCRHRSPWYSQERRTPATFMCTYMGRTSGDSDRLFRFIYNRSNAIAANVYLLLYPKPLLQRLIDEDPDLVNELWSVLSNVKSTHVAPEGRVYGGGLHKIEPNELGNVTLIDIPEKVKAEICKTHTQLNLQV